VKPKRSLPVLLIVSNFGKSNIQTVAPRLKPLVLGKTALPKTSLKPVVLGEGLPALFLCFWRKENRKRKERAEIARVIFLEDSGRESGGEEEGKRLGGTEGMRVRGYKGTLGKTLVAEDCAL
jgi:hypothetical protein